MIIITPLILCAYIFPQFECHVDPCQDTLLLPNTLVHLSQSAVVCRRFLCLLVASPCCPYIKMSTIFPYTLPCSRLLSSPLKQSYHEQCRPPFGQNFCAPLCKMDNLLTTCSTEPFPIHFKFPH